MMGDCSINVGGSGLENYLTAGSRQRSRPSSYEANAAVWSAEATSFMFPLAEAAVAVILEM